MTAERGNVWAGVPTQAQDGGEYVLAYSTEVVDIASVSGCGATHVNDDGGSVCVHLLLHFRKLTSASALEGFNDYGLEECWFFNCHDISIAEIEINTRFIFGFFIALCRSSRDHVRCQAVRRVPSMPLHG